MKQPEVSYMNYEPDFDRNVMNSFMAFNLFAVDIYGFFKDDMDGLAEIIGKYDDLIKTRKGELENVDNLSDEEIEVISRQAYADEVTDYQRHQKEYGADAIANMMFEENLRKIEEISETSPRMVDFKNYMRACLEADVKRVNEEKVRYQSAPVMRTVSEQREFMKTEIRDQLNLLLETLEEIREEYDEKCYRMELKAEVRAAFPDNNWIY